MQSTTAVAKNTTDMRRAFARVPKSISLPLIDFRIGAEL
jgi:hypothetical protein